MSRDSLTAAGRRIGVSASRLAPVAALLLITGCVANPAPARWLPTPYVGANDPWGAFITVTLTATSANDTGEVQGEFLAVDRDTVFVLLGDSVVRRISHRDIAKAQIAWFDSDWELQAWWTALGAISTLTHGFGVILTMPIWGLTAWGVVPAESRAPLVDVNRVGWEAVKQYARYPAAAPGDLPDRLPPKPPYPRPASTP